MSLVKEFIGRQLRIDGRIFRVHSRHLSYEAAGKEASKLRRKGYYARINNPDEEWGPLSLLNPRYVVYKRPKHFRTTKQRKGYK